MSEKYIAIIAVTVVIIKNNQILLLRRKNTGYMDGYYAVPGGHLEPGETLKEGALRELKEETGLDANLKDLRLFQILHENQDPPYMSFRFYAKHWSGEPSLGDPERSDDIRFFDIDKLPKVTPYVHFDLGALGKKEVTIRYVKAEELKV